MLRETSITTAIGKTLVLLMCFLIPRQVLAWGAPTHYAITRIALEEKADNLDFFLKTFGLEGNLPNEATAQPIEPCSLENFLRDEFLMKELGFSIEGCTAHNLITAGGVLEDKDFRRSACHFYDPQNDRGWQGKLKAWEWGINGGSCFTVQNEFFWKRAVDEYFKTAIVGQEPEDRMRGKEKLFVTLGHVAHLLEDMSQPAHVRNDAHIKKWGFSDPNKLEEFAAKAEVTYEKYGTENMTYPYLSSGPLRQAIQAEPEPQRTVLTDYFYDLAKFTNAEFFSDDNILNKLSEFPTPNHETTEPRTELMSNEEISIPLDQIPVDPSLPKVTVWKDESTFLVSKGLYPIEDLNSDFTGNSTTKPRLARENKGLSHFVNSTGLVWSNYTMQDSRNLVLQDNARVLIPKAVVYARAIINYFFRGQLELKVDRDNPNQLQIKNLSQENNSFAGGFELFYKTEGGKVLPIDSSSVPMEVGVGESKPIGFDVSAYLGEKRNQFCPDDKDNCPREDNCVIAYFKGQIGQEEGVAAAQTSIPGNLSVLLVFDTSGSMEGEIGNARNAGLDLLTSLEKGKNNRVAIQSFSDSVSASGFSNDIQSAKASIPSGTGGGTALYDAMVSAGNVASGEAEAHPENKVVVVLYTDGGENASGSSHADAVSALYSQTSKIDKVLLVYGGNYSSATQQLQNLASQAGQESSTISSFDQLGTEFNRAIGMCRDG